MLVRYLLVLFLAAAAGCCTACKPGVLMKSGDILMPNDVIENSKLGVFIKQQRDGNVVVTREETGEIVWASGYDTNLGNFYTKLQRDGNLVTRKFIPSDFPVGTTVWKSNETRNKGEFFLGLSCDGKSVSIYRGTPDNPGRAIWTDKTFTNLPVAAATCEPGVLMKSGDKLTHDNNFKVDANFRNAKFDAFIRIQHDGNLVVRQGTAANPVRSVWSSGIGLKYDDFNAKLQGDGNLVVRRDGDSSESSVIWKSSSNGDDGNYFLAINCDGNSISIYKGTPDNRGAKVWTSGPDSSGRSYEPGIFTDKRKSSDGKVILSNGLSAVPIVQKGEFVKFSNGQKSKERFHKRPDGAAVYEGENGGWLYVSNAENHVVGTDWKNGGVGVIEFDAGGNVVGYRKLLKETRSNCGGGPTPWGTWISGEEIEGGFYWQVDPHGKKSPTRLDALGNLGYYEAFASDDRNDDPKFYMSRDKGEGVISRFTPNEKGKKCYREKDPYKRWCTLENGTLDYLYLTKDGRAKWIKDLAKASARAADIHPNCEGIVVLDGVLHFTSKTVHLLFRVNLETNKYDYSSTVTGRFENQPDQLYFIEGDNLLYMCEDGGNAPGVYARDAHDKVYTVLHADFLDNDETTGVAFNPDGTHMYVCFQEVGVIYDVTRDDGLSFKDEPRNVEYHVGTELPY